MHQKHGSELTESKTEPVLLAQTRVPGGVGKSQNKGKGIWRTSVETWKGKCQLGVIQVVSSTPDMLVNKTRPASLNCSQSINDNTGSR